MSTRTKSFFQQDHGAKHRGPGQWQNRPTTRPPLQETPSNLRPPKPPFVASSQAKSKLKAFEFHNELADGDSEQATDDKDDHEDGKDHPHDRSLQEEPQILSQNARTQVSEGDQHIIEDQSRPCRLLTFPSTPSAALSLEDLIGNCDEVRKPEPILRSPEEQIGWIPNSSNVLLTPNRKRKRARSSSPSCQPTSSQRNEALTHSLTTSFERNTPKADPAADLWQRYGAAREGDKSSVLPDLSHLVFLASPNPVETPAKTSGLRRWASTGNDWPSSRIKKRRTTGRNSISMWQDEVADAADPAVGKSRVAALVEQLQQSLATKDLAKPKLKSALRADEPSSSSPLPDTGALGLKAPAVSPLVTKQLNLTHPSLRDDPQSSAMTVKRATKHDHREAKKCHSRAQPAPSLIDLAPLHLDSKTLLPAFNRPSISQALSTRPESLSTTKSPDAKAMEELCEFDDDFDILPDELDELEAQVFSAHPVNKSLPGMNPTIHATKSTGSGWAVEENPVDVDSKTDDDDDEFGCSDFDDDELAKAEISATQAFRAIKKVVDSTFINAKGHRFPEAVLLAEDLKTNSIAAITLRGSWTPTSVSTHDIIHVAHRSGSEHVGDSTSPKGQIMIDDSPNSPFLIVHPDHMLSATTVADSFDCIRKAVLQDRIKATGETSKAMVYGKILHEIFQQALSSNGWNDGSLSELVSRTVQNHVESLWELGMRDNILAIEEVKSKMGEVAAWAATFISAEPSERATVDDKYGEKIWMSISKLIAIEEHVWAPKFGLKGNIDATVQASVLEHPKEDSKKLVIPFEVKTGRTTQTPAHRAQTALYTLLLSDRYGVDVKAGILYYLESSSMTRIAPPINEIRQMIQQRNRLARYIHRARNPAPLQHNPKPSPELIEIEESGLPALLKDPFKCGKCYAQQSCFTYHALAERGSAESAGMVDDGKKNYGFVWQEAVGHLLHSSKSDKGQTAALKQWYEKWDMLLTFEESDLSRLRKELWIMSSKEREAVGRCFSNMAIAKEISPVAAEVRPTLVDGIEGNGGKINRFTYAFARASDSMASLPVDSSQLTVGEPIVVSSESGQWALANGYVIALNKHEVTVALDRKLGSARQRLQGFDDENNQAFRGVMTVGRDAQDFDTRRSVLYRVDKDEFSNGLALVRNNLVTLMSSHPIHTKLRGQIVFSTKPSFTESAHPQLPLTQLGQMNEDQQGAVNKVMSMQDYALILGMPGTGKTTTIAHIIRALLAQDKTILLTSYTHTAVDNILLKIRHIVPPKSILRLGVPTKINSEVQTFCQLASTPRKTIDEVDEAYMGCKIVASTCMGTNHPIFHRRSFDVCIVDEASQITLPISLGPLLHARAFVLVGDHYQLPPLVQNRHALEGGLDMSLFRQLSEQHPGAVAALGKQYRMCRDIMTLSNELIYNGQLRCGSEEVSNRQLHLPHPSALAKIHSTPTNCTHAADCWLGQLTTPSRRVVFANTDVCGKAAHETLSSGQKLTNALEATLTAQLVVTMLAQGVPARDVGVITLYRSQLALLRHLFKLAGVSSDVEIDSADRYQGRDKECIILSMVRSNTQGIVGDLLKDWRRVNVSLTRARSKLIILGSRRTLKHNELLAKFLDLVARRAWTIDLPQDADTNHNFDFSSQLASGLTVTRSPEKKKKKKTGDRTSPTRPGTVPLRALTSSSNAANRSPAKSSPKGVAKVALKHGTGFPFKDGLKVKRMKESLAIEIFDECEYDF